MARRRAIEAFVCHHSAGAAGNVAEFTRLHKSRGFSTIGYHALIGSGKGAGDGEIQYGRPASRDGAGVWGNNRRKLHVVCVGNYERGDSGYTGPPSHAQINSLKVLLMDWARKFRQPDGSKPKLVGHREIARPGHGTACPGSDFPLEELRRWYREVE